MPFPAVTSCPPPTAARTGPPGDPIPELTSIGRSHGFEVVGVTSGDLLDAARDALRAWLAAGHHAGMGWMARDPDGRADPRRLSDEVRSVVTVAVAHASKAPPFEAEGRYGRVARYAWGRDYHGEMLPRLRAMGEDVKMRLGARRFFALTDHAPFLERAAAVRAGVGFAGKNTCLIRPREGSWFLLGELLVDVDLPPTAPSGAEHCGTCTRCLPACPTDAFVAPYVLDARRCVSYLTIEHRGAIDRALRPRMGAWVFGCDVCQEVCPFNEGRAPVPWPSLEPDQGVGPRLDLVETLSLCDDDAFRRRFAGTPLLRPRRAGLLRNAAIAARNVGATAAVPALVSRVTDDSEPGVRGPALFALFGLAPDRARPLADRARRADPDPTVRAEAEAGLAES